MPLPAGALVAGASVLGAGINAFQTQGQNRRSREWADYMYEKQKLDNIEFWNMQNAYNSPTRQMARLKEAGLNPALLYGGSATGAAGQAGSVHTPDVKEPQFRVPEIGNALQNVAQIYDLAIKQAQVNNLEADNTVKMENAMLLRAQGDRSRFDLNFERGLQSTSAEARREDLRKRKADTQFQISENQRRDLMNAKNMEEVMERIGQIKLNQAKTSEEIENVKATRANIRKDTQLKQQDLNLRENNIFPHDDIFWRVMLKIWEQYGPGLKLSPSK